MLLFASIRRHRLGLKTATLACNSHKAAGGIDSGKDAPRLWAAGSSSRPSRFPRTSGIRNHGPCAAFCVGDGTSPEEWITNPAQPSDFTAWIPDEVYLFG